MSIQALAWVLEHSRATLGDRLVLLAIANHAKADGKDAWPSIRMIAVEALVSERTAQRSVQNLVELGELVIEEESGPRRPRTYSIVGVPICHPRGDKYDIEGRQIRQRNKEEPSLKQPSKSCDFCLGTGWKPSELQPGRVRECHCTTTNASSAAD